MAKTPSFTEIICDICKRPSMYTGGSVKETLAFIDGYRFGNSTPISGRTFDRFVCIRNSFPSNYAWTYVVQSSTINEEEGMSIEHSIKQAFIGSLGCSFP